MSLVEELQKLLCLNDDKFLTRFLEHSNNLDGLSDSGKHAVKIKCRCIDALMKLQFSEKPKKKLDICLDEVLCRLSCTCDILVIDEAANLKGDPTRNEG